MRPLANVVFAMLMLVPTVVGQNSTRKIRVVPGKLAAQVGSAVPWREDVTAAMREARESGKPVFWYVPSVARSPMDRKPEIDRYMMGGPFSWPTTIELLRTRFVPVREVPRGALQRQFDLVRNRFIEPGYLVLDGDGEVLQKVDQITTFHPRWFEAPLRRLVGAPSQAFPGAPALREAWQAYRLGARDRAIALAEELLDRRPSDAVAAEAHWLCGAALCRDNRASAARRRWNQLAQALPEQPLAWKAALEAEGHGPFARGFEDYLPLPGEVLEVDPVDGSRAPDGVYDEAELWRRSVALLLTLDDGDGVIRDSTYDFGGTDGLPNVHAAITCLCGMALLAAEARIADGRLQVDDRTRAGVAAMLRRVRKNAMAESWLALSDRDEIVWARAYAVRFLAAWQRRHADDAEVGPALRNAVGALLTLQPETGAWFHEYGNPFATATALQALHEAGEAGVELDDDRIARGLAALAKNRTAEGAFSYSHTRRGRPRATVIGSAGRMPLCELALFVFGKSDMQRLEAAVAAGLQHHAVMGAVRKYDDHADRHGYGGFFFWFDMLARTEAMARLGDAGGRAATLAKQRALLYALPEFDGCFVDSHELGRAYGTAMALLCLDAVSRPPAASK